LMLGGCGQPAHLTGAKFLALGDSYTIGQSIDPDQCWPKQLAAALRQRGIDVADPTIIAQTGWTTADLSDAMESANLTGPYDLVGLLIGVNNQFQGKSEDEYRRGFTALLKRAIALAGGRAGRVIVVSIPDYGVTPFAKGNGFDPARVGAAIDRFNAINLEETQKAGALYVNITPFTRQHPDWVADDALHPTGAAYALWMPQLSDAAARSLGTK
jgi:lysophospholipase L1-like esterase